MSAYSIEEAEHTQDPVSTKKLVALAAVGTHDPPHARHGRVRQVTTHQEATMRVLASTKSLRALAAQFGVSRETIRALLRQNRVAAG